MSSTGDDGGPMFPDTFRVGVTLRDWFAGVALAGMLARPSSEDCAAWTAFAGDAYGAADAMLEVRKGPIEEVRADD